jgi:hypothetical protein
MPYITSALRANPCSSTSWAAMRNPPSLLAFSTAVRASFASANVQLAQLSPLQQSGSLCGIALRSFQRSPQLRLDALDLVWPCYLRRTRRGPVLHATPPPWWRRLFRRPLYLELHLHIHAEGCHLAFRRAYAGVVASRRRTAHPLQFRLSQAQLAQVEALHPDTKHACSGWFWRLTESVTR